MKTLLQTLVRLQALELREIREPNRAAVIEQLRAQIPPQILAHYDRLMARGKKGIIAVRNQVCTGCHMRVPMGVVMNIMRGLDIQLCDNCGRYLYLEEPTPVAPETRPKAKPAQKPRKRKLVVPIA